MRLMLIGGNSRLGQAVARACPSATLMMRGHAENAGNVTVADYHSAVAANFAGHDVAINCTGLIKGDAAALYKANAALPVHLAARAREVGIRHFIHISSFAVHGRADRIDMDTPIRPIGRYGQSKAAGEGALLGGSEPVTVLRLPMLYGEGNSKLASLIRTWVRIGWWPVPRTDIARAMMHYDLAASLLMRLAAEQPRGAIAAADVEPFSYAVAQSAIRSAGRKGERISLPGWIVRGLRTVGGHRAQALFADSWLSDTSNEAVAMGLPSRLRSDIAAMVPR